MARGRPKAGESERVRPVMARHIRALGLGSVSLYFAWCAANGLAASLEKSVQQRADELEVTRERLKAARARARLHHNPRRFLQMACRDEIDLNEVSRPGWREMAIAIGRSRSDRREGLLEFLNHVDAASDLVFATATTRRETTPYLAALIRLHDRKRQWIRPLKAWRPKSHNTGKQFGSLARHLLARFDVPAFMDAVWLRGDTGAYRFRDWFVHLGAGKNIRTAKTPYPMTRMMAHCFCAAPNSYSIEAALMLADILSLGGGRRLAEALMATRLGARIETAEEKRAFWLSVYRFFIDNPMLDLRHAGPIVDFLAFQKFESQDVAVGPMRIERRPPPQPNLSMSRRSPDSLLRQVAAWHGELRVSRASDASYWSPSKWSGLSVETGPRDQRTTWRLRELLRGQELVDEGRQLRHCVASYVDSCIRGSCSIWSLERRTPDGDTAKMLTLEVASGGLVVEARGYANRWPTDQEKAILEVWMGKAGLRPGPYLRGW